LIVSSEDEIALKLLFSLAHKKLIIFYIVECEWKSRKVVEMKMVNFTLAEFPRTVDVKQADWWWED
jgi:hypothetical protein